MELLGMEPGVLQSHPQERKNCSKSLEALGKAPFLSTSLRMVPSLALVGKIFTILAVNIRWEKSSC